MYMFLLHLVFQNAQSLTVKDNRFINIMYTFEFANITLRVHLTKIKAKKVECTASLKNFFTCKPFGKQFSVDNFFDV